MAAPVVVVKVLFGLALLAAVASGSPRPSDSNTNSSSSSSSSSSELPRPSYARTMLKVSRSLPGETEELKVKTSEGSVATLIVKRREKSESAPAAPPATTSASPTPTSSASASGFAEPWSRAQSWSGVSDAWRPVEQPAWAAEGSSRALADGQRILRYAFLPHEPARRTNVGANLDKNRDAKDVPAEVVIRSEISVKPQPKRLITVDPDGTPVVHGRRVPDEPIDKLQVWRNARVINDQLVTDPTHPAAPEPAHGFDTFFEHVNRRYGKTSDSSEPKQYRNEVLAAEIYESGEESSRPSIRKRMLQPELQSGSYPNSRLYSTAETVPAVKVGTRAPVLQYAHPELGVQPAKVVKNERKESSSGNPARSSYGEHRQKKKYVLNDKNLVDSYNYKNYYQNTHFYGLKKPTYEPPFWIKISENIKSGFTDGVAKVSELTKPVFDPLVEATRKISQNLGLSRSAEHQQQQQQQQPAQDKIGSVATGSSVLIPALGLMASGAALGIGAVAVGRYLDVDVLKRSNDGLQLLDRRSQPDGVYVLVQPRQPDDEQPDRTARTKRSSPTSSDASRKIQRKGADRISEILEIDLPSRSLDDDPTNDEGNDIIRLENEEGLAKAIVDKTLEAITSKTKSTEKQPSEEEESERKIMRRRRTTTTTRTRRRRRSATGDEDELEDPLQKLQENSAEPAEGAGRVEGDWTNTPCAKRLFCDAMLKRNTDDHMLMEKKMSGLLKMIQPGAAVQVSAHFDEVMDAVRRHDCSIFSCPQARPAGVFF